MTSSPSPWRLVAGLALALTVLLSTLLVAFGLPAVHTAPRDVPIALVATDEVATRLTTALDQAQPGAFDVRKVESDDEARDLIRDREVYGAIVVGADGVSVDIASAASLSVSQLVTAVGQQVATQLGATATVEDVVPLSADDPRGVGLSAGALPIALGGQMAGVLISTVISGNARRIGAMALFAVLAGFAMTAVLEFWFGTFTGSFPVTSAAAILGILATGMTVLGLEQLLGRVGIGVAAIVVVFLGNPLSGLTSAPELLPQPWGAIGQLLPPGATGTLLRNIAFFDGAAIGKPLLVLAAWLALGALTFWAGSRRSKTEPVVVQA